MSEVRSVEYDAKLLEVARLAIAHEACRAARASARRELSRQRKAWLATGADYWTPEDRSDDDEEIFAAHNAREAANAALRKATSDLRRAIKRATR